MTLGFYLDKLNLKTSITIRGESTSVTDLGSLLDIKNDIDPLNPDQPKNEGMKTWLLIVIILLSSVGIASLSYAGYYYYQQRKTGSDNYKDADTLTGTEHSIANKTIAEKTEIDPSEVTQKDNDL